MKENPIIQAAGLDKKYSEVHAVKAVDFSIHEGEIFSLLGPNGAGKSTTISMLTTLLKPTGGDAVIKGSSVTKSPMEVKKLLGVVPQDLALYQDLNAVQNLRFWGKLYGLRGSDLGQRIERVLEMVGLSERQKQRVDKFSGGMKRRLNIAAALLHDPEIIIMDEPTVGIDPQSRRHILDNVKKLNQAGKTVLYTTHYMEEAQELSHNIAIMDHGNIVAYGTHEELVRRIGEQDRIVLTVSAQTQQHTHEISEKWQSVTGVRAVTQNENEVIVLADDSNKVLPDLFEIATREESRITSVDIMEPNLEAVFLHLTGHSLRD